MAHRMTSFRRDLCLIFGAIFLLWIILAIVFITFDNLDTNLYGTIIILNNTNSTIHNEHANIKYQPIPSTEEKPITTELHQPISDRSKPNYPSTWQQLNEQQFCRIEESQTQIDFFQFLHHNQFPHDCNASSTKFLLFDIYLEAKNGLGASLFGAMMRYFTTALMLNRTFLLHGVFDWSSIVDHCADTNAMECYFLPLSNCDSSHLVDSINKTDKTLYYEGKGPTDCIFGNNNPYHNLSHCTHKVIYINRKNRNRPVMERSISSWTKTTFDMSHHEYAGLITSFLLRPQPLVRDIVFDKITKSVWKSLDGNVERLDRHKTKYFVVLKSSSWTKLMWNWISQLNCNINHPEKHAIKSSKCIGLEVPGYTSTMRNQKFVVWSHDICSHLKHLHATRESVYERFGIHMGAPKWDYFCQDFCK
eukprot:1154781_1